MIQKVYTEEWRPVVGYEGLYEVSNLGRVKSLDRVVNCGIKNHTKRTILSKILSINADKKTGYVKVTFTKNNRSYSKYVHRLVAEAFITNPEGFTQVNHKDENKANNAVWNLEWCDRLYNLEYNGGIQRRLETRRRRGTAKTDPKPVLGVSVKDGTVLRYNSIRDAIKDGFYYVGECVRGERINPISKGYKWSYA